MAETMTRYNAGKLKLGYWLSMEAWDIEPGDTGYETVGRGSAEKDLETALAQFATDHIDATCLVDALKQLLGDDQVGEYFTRACEYGEKKYWRGGFMFGAPISQYIDSAARHLKALRTTGAEYEETYTKDGIEHTAQLNHWEGACWNIVMIYEVMYHAPQRDDRLFHKGDYSGQERIVGPVDLCNGDDESCGTVPAPKYVGSRTFTVAADQARDQALTLGDLPRCEADDGRLSYDTSDEYFTG